MVSCVRGSASASGVDTVELMEPSGKGSDLGTTESMTVSLWPGWEAVSTIETIGAQQARAVVIRDRWFLTYRTSPKTLPPTLSLSHSLPRGLIEQKTRPVNTPGWGRSVLYTGFAIQDTFPGLPRFPRRAHGGCRTAKKKRENSETSRQTQETRG